MWLWFLDLQDLCNHPKINAANALRLEPEIRALISQFKEVRKQDPLHPGEADADGGWDAEFHLILGASLHIAGRHDEAIEELQYAVANSDNLHHVEELVITCLRVGRIDTAAETVNALTRERMETEHDSTARKFVKWALQYPGFLEVVHADQWKMFLQLIAAYSDSSPMEKMIAWK